MTQHAYYHSEGGTTEESLHVNFINLTKYHWLTNERFFAEFILSVIFETHKYSIPHTKQKILHFVQNDMKRRAQNDKGISSCDVCG